MFTFFFDFFERFWGADEKNRLNSSTVSAVETPMMSSGALEVHGHVGTDLKVLAYRGTELSIFKYLFRFHTIFLRLSAMTRL